ncbi:MAG: type II secretion system F family protein, partial [Bacillota bacterium]|nr:type II secretion system F family protein [Bacillota bacterium]
DVFPPIFYNMVAAGEIAGSLDEVLNRAANHFEREHEVESKVKAALFYPKMVVGVIILVCTFLVAFVVPKFAELFSGMGVALPLPTRMLIGLGTIVTNWWWLIGLVSIGIYVLVSWYQSTPQGKVVFDRMALHLPIFGELNKKNFVSRFCRSLATLTRSGVPIIPAMMLVRQTLGNYVIAESLASAQEAIRTGQGIAPQLEKSGYFPPLVIQMVEVGEETGSLDIMLERASDFYDAEIKAMTEQMTQLIEPIVFLVLGVIVTFIILAIMLPMFDSLKMVG